MWPLSSHTPFSPALRRLFILMMRMARRFCFWSSRRWQRSRQVRSAGSPTLASRSNAATGQLPDRRPLGEWSHAVLMQADRSTRNEKSVPQGRTLSTIPAYIVNKRGNDPRYNPARQRLDREAETVVGGPRRLLMNDPEIDRARRAA